MAISLLAELYDSEGNKIDESFFGGLQPARTWASENNATFIRVFDVEEEQETYYLKSGSKGRWSETTEKMYNFVVSRNKESKS